MILLVHGSAAGRCLTENVFTTPPLAHLKSEMSVTSITSGIKY
jgi:hypothetical protein